MSGGLFSSPAAAAREAGQDKHSVQAGFPARTLGKEQGWQRGWSGSQGSPLSSPQTQLRLGGEAGTEPPAGLSPRQEAVSAFPTLLLLFGKEVATARVPVALGHFSPLLPRCVYDSGVYFSLT